MQLPIYQLDAFTDHLFGGNPAAVVPLTSWLPDETLQAIAAENNLAETAFYIPTDSGFHIRWFTPAIEVDLCGHATLATAYVLFFVENYVGEQLSFDSRSGILNVRKEADWLILDFPVDTLHKQLLAPPALLEAFGDVTPVEIFRGKTDFMAVLENEEQVRSLQPDVIVLSTLPVRGVIVTAKGEEVDFVSRFFAPQSGIAEDPVTGSAHTTLTPYWAEKLGKTELNALQVSKRGGVLKTKLLNDRVEIAGQVRLYLRGTIEIA
ncbi:PhzF family phenazine biosynthesis protein [Runella slithyformis]|uniref:Phenazine biosynthesis protein PhzF family n=1 Tax=Runella slithyformis (strain ATCC 29530 / DSM 19594 / LMG 11500 / NCIMB 11436 / LSU 4) TaxID=761193 RepID=A0A7U3ZH27_RUNSL|nr:PhzF family phenazine biosynthesis protein [Runella slithyformis]AEI47097.1 phenazine biosynthesis protein PhzF family [Runella slithyformis DSM 19594]